MAIEIVKVQHPLFPHGAPWLICDEACKRISRLSDTVIPKHVKEAMNGYSKAFFNGDWSSVDGWGLSERVEDQVW